MRALALPERKYHQDLTIREDYRIQREEIVESDIRYFVTCLEYDRGTKYSDLGKPDAKYHNDKRPDRLVEEQDSHKQLAIEYADLRKSQADTEELAYELKQQGISAGSPFPDAQELAIRLVGLIDEKKHKDQFINYPNAERILLFRNRWAWYSDAGIFHRCSQYLELPIDPGCEHCYILLSTGEIIEVF